MNMNRQMLIQIEVKSYSKIINKVGISNLFVAKIGIKFYTSKLLALFHPIIFLAEGNPRLQQMKPGTSS